LSAAAKVTMIYNKVVVMLRFSHLQAHPEQYFGKRWFSSMVPPVLYAALCAVMGAVFNPISRILNDYEMYHTKVSVFCERAVR
jgi:hypothetical protein